MPASIRIVAVALAVAAVVLGAGCATRVKVQQADPALARLLAEQPLVALGGVAVAPTLGATFAPQDAQDAEDALLRAFLAGRPELVAWPAGVVADRVGHDVLQALADEYGRVGRLRPDQMVGLQGSLAGGRLLALARLTNDQLRSRTVGQDGFDPARTSSADDHRSPWAMSVTTERTATVTLELFDLATGRSVWCGEATARDQERYQYEDPLQRDPDRYLQESLAATGEPAHLDRRGTYLKLPDLVALIEQALLGLVQRLPDTSGR